MRRTKARLAVAGVVGAALVVAGVGTARMRGGPLLVAQTPVDDLEPLFVTGQTATYGLNYAMTGTYHGPLPGATRPLHAGYDGVVTVAHVAGADFRLSFTAERPWEAMVALSSDGKLMGLGFPPETLPEQRALTRTLLTFLERPAPAGVAFTFDAPGKPVRTVRATRRVTHRMASRVIGEEASTFAMTLRGDSLGQAPRLVVGPRASDLSGREDLVEAKQQRLRERLAGADAAALENALDVAAAANGGTGATMKELQPLYLKLVALFTLDDDACARFADVLAHLSYPSSTFDTVATALATAGTPASQAALRDAFNSMADPAARQILVPHLGNVRTPTEATETFLAQLAQSRRDAIGKTAVLALGSVAFNLHDDPSRRSENIGSSLASRLRSTSDPNERDLYLSALGNAGDRLQTDVIIPFTKSEDADLRSLAAHALRHVVSDDARAAVAALAADDPDERVRTSAIEALAGSDAVYAAVPFYEDLLRRETSVPVVKALLQNLARLVPQDPAAHPALSAYAARSGHPDIAPYAKSLLGSWSAQSN